jgi:hypothetical protein
MIHAPTKKRLPPGTHPRIRFWTKVDYSGDCWLWAGATNGSGYGQFKAGPGAPVMAHRWAHEDILGPIPDGHEVDHLCGTKLCVRPEHLEAVTPWTNKMRSTSGSAKNFAKTHCVNGHEFTPENTYKKSDGSRVCVACRRLAGARHRAKVKKK